MIKKLNNLQRIIDCGLIVVVRTESPDEASRIAEACIKGGVAGIEITLTVPDALAVIKTLSHTYKDEIIVGAGTVLDSETARAAILAGAEFVVSPMLNRETIKLCNRYQVISMAGAMTMKEIVEAMEVGTDIVKVFPGELLTPTFVKAAKGPLPQAPIMPTGGITPTNVGEWIKVGCVAVGVGGYITNAAKTGDYKKVTALAQEFIAKIAAVRRL